MIIDTKYKKQDNNADYFQVIAYSLAIPSAKAACLIYPNTEKNIEKELTLRRNITNGEEENVILYARPVDLHIDEQMEFKKYINDIKAQIKIIISKCLKD